MGVSLAAFYSAIMAKRGFSLPKHFIPIITALEDNRIQKLIVLLGPSSGKSELLDTIYPAWVLGKNPEKSVLAISAGETLVVKFLKSSVDIIENSPYFQMSFPGVKLNKSLGYSPERGYYTNGKAAGDSNPSYIATGLDSRLLTGLHADILIWDDLHDKESEFSRDACDKVISTVYSTLLHRDVPEGSRYICIGRRWSTFDVYGHLQDTGNWVVMTLPVERGPGVSNLWWDVLVPEGLSCCFTDGGAELQTIEKYHIDKKLVPYKVYYGTDPEKKGFYWPDYPKLRSRCMDIKRGSPDHFQSVFQCNPGSREGSVFLEKDFRYFSLPAVSLSPQNLPDFLTTARIIQSWDTSQKKKEDSDYSVCITAAILPCNKWHKDEDSTLSGDCDPHFDIYILDVFRKKLDINELLIEVRNLYKLWKPSRVIMEDRASGIAVLQALQNSGIPILGLSSENKSKRVRATETLGNGAWSAQGWMQQGRLLLWEEAPWLNVFKAELKDFIGDGSGLDDIVDSAVYLIRYVIGLGNSTPILPTNLNIDTMEKLPLKELAAIDSRAEGLARIEVLLAPQEYSNIPAICATCAMHQSDNLCLIYNRKTAGIDSCSLHRYKEKFLKKEG